MFEQFKVTVFDKPLLDFYIKFRKLYDCPYVRAQKDYLFDKKNTNTFFTTYFLNVGQSNSFKADLKMTHKEGIFTFELILKNLFKSIAKWEINDVQDDIIESGIVEKFLKAFGINDVFKREKENLTPIPFVFNGEKTNIYNYCRLTKIKSNSNAKSIEIFIRNAGESEEDRKFNPEKWNLCVVIKDLEEGITLKSEEPFNYHEFDGIMKEYDTFKSHSLANGFVDEQDFKYIPANATKSNWNFTANVKILKPIIKQEKEEIPPQPSQQAIQQVSQQPSQSSPTHLDYTDDEISSLFAKGNRTKRTAQYNSGMGPIGSDLSGRMGFTSLNHSQPSWGFLQNYYSGQSLETRLSRDFMWPLAKDINQNHQNINVQLEKQFKNIPKQNPKLSVEESLEKDRDIYYSSYKSIEELLKNKRPHPLMKPLKKASMIKEATLFGWYNNFDISDGKTLEGMGDRVYKFDQIQEDLDGRGRDTRHQERYNPSYDANGFYYKFIDFKSQPYLFNDPTKDYDMIHPAKRFAELEKSIEESTVENSDESSFIVSVLENFKNKIESKKIKAARFIISEDLMDLINEFFQDYSIYFFDNKDGNKSCWVSKCCIDNVQEVEGFFEGKEDQKDFVDELTGLFSFNTKNAEEIISEIQEICLDQNFNNIFIIGEIAREYIQFMNGDNHNINSKVMDICCEEGKEEDLIVIAQHLSSKIGKSLIVTEKDNLILNFNGIEITFYSGNLIIPKELENNTKLEAIVRNRDLTINSIGINIFNKEIFDPFNNIKDIENKILKTNIPIEKTIELNPNVVNKIKELKKNGWVFNEEK